MNINIKKVLFCILFAFLTGAFILYFIPSNESGRLTSNKVKKYSDIDSSNSLFSNKSKPEAPHTYKITSNRSKQLTIISPKSPSQSSPIKERLLEKSHIIRLSKLIRKKNTKAFFSYIEKFNIDLNSQLNSYGMRAMDLVLNLGPEAIEKAMVLGGQIESPTRATLYYAVSTVRDFETFEYLVSHPTIDIHRLDQMGRNAFTQSVILGKKDRALLLLQRGADFRLKDKFGKDVLDHLANSAKSTVESFEILMDLGFLLNDTHMSNVVQRGSTKVLDYVLDHGANLHFTDKDGNNAMDLVVKLQRNRNSLDRVKYLHQKGFEFTPKQLADAKQRAKESYIKTVQLKNGGTGTTANYPEAKKILKYIETHINY